MTQQDRSSTFDVNFGSYQSYMDSTVQAKADIHIYV